MLGMFVPFDVVCVSGNPSVDRRLRLESLRVGEVNRATSVEALPGGKAAHVAMACAGLGLQPAWVGLLGGAIGEECASGLRTLGISVAAVTSTSSSRLNFEIIDGSGGVTEILEPGTPPSPEEQEQLLKVCDDRFKSEWRGAIVALSGSLPRGAAPDFYANLIRKAHEAGLKTFLDTSGEWLLAALEARPDFVKINAAEAQAIKPAAHRDIAWALGAAQELMQRGAASAAITLGAEGIVWRSPDGAAWFARPPELNCLSAVGSGDCTLAGFVYAARKGFARKEALSFAAACGAANCGAKITARISLPGVNSLLQRVTVDELI